MILIEFYKNNIEANNKKDYKFSEILEWPDYKLEVEHDFIQWLFPDKTGGTNKNAPKLSRDDIEIFKKDKTIRTNVLKAIVRMLRFYGYIIVKDDVVQVQNLKRMEKGVYIGLYSEHNYKRLTRMMVFLNKIDMKILSRMIMLSLCYAMRKDKFLRHKFLSSGALNHWFDSQDYLKPYIGRIKIEDESEIKESEASDTEASDTGASDSEASDTGASDSEASDSEASDTEHVCKITGLKYVGNSCYQDSTLLALFALPNEFTTKNILEKDLKNISYSERREIKCGDSSDVDFVNRRKIQDELVKITKSMRREIPENERSKYCSNLRKLIKICPSASKQKFHETKTQDAGEFVQYLFNIFEINTMKTVKKTFVTNDLEKQTKDLVKSSENVTIVPPIINISAENLIPGVSIEHYVSYSLDDVFDDDNLIRGPDGKLYRRRIENFSYLIPDDFVMFYVNRLYYNMKKDREERAYTSIIPSEKINNLDLYAVVVHDREHYTCYIKCDGKWFYYNDTSEKITPVGTYTDMINDRKRPNVKTHGVLYFYK
jgi:hypothetical protein